jgi:hypothetical protein
MPGLQRGPRALRRGIYARDGDNLFSTIAAGVGPDQRVLTLDGQMSIALRNAGEPMYEY